MRYAENIQRRSAMEKYGLTISSLLAVAAFFWGIYEYKDTAKQKLLAQKNDAERTAETRRIEATRPYLDKQLELYTEATKVTATIATSADIKEIEKATKRFEELYWGELALVERSDVASAMISFRKAFDTKMAQSALAPLALALAHACRDELAESWRTDVWKR